MLIINKSSYTRPSHGRVSESMRRLSVLPAPTSTANGHAAADQGGVPPRGSDSRVGGQTHGALGGRAAAAVGPGAGDSVRPAKGTSGIPPQDARKAPALRLRAAAASAQS